MGRKNVKVRPAVKRAHVLMDTDPRGALALIDAALEIEPDDPQAQFVRGQVLAFHLNQPKEARKSLQAAYATVVKEGYFVPGVHRAFAKCLAMLDERKLARKVLDGCLSVYPDELDAWIDRADISYREGAQPAALADLDEVLSRDARNPLALYNRACYLAVGGSTDAALDALEAAIAVTPGDRDSAREDDDFKSLRKLARFKTLVGR